MKKGDTIGFRNYVERDYNYNFLKQEEIDFIYSPTRLSHNSRSEQEIISMIA